MPSSFFELSVASTGLFTSKGALNVVSHNIANATTKGYSRQVAQVSARTPLNYYNGRGTVGTGSELYGIGQIRNFYIDTKYWNVTGRLGEYSAKSTQNMLLQAVFNETDDTGFNVNLNSLFSALSRDLSTDAGNTTARLNVIQQADILTSYFNSTAISLERQQADINTEVKALVSQINNLGQQLQNLNKQIYTSEIGGQQANDLRDQRALIIDELSKYVNVEAQEIEVNKNLLTGESEKRFQVTINGYDFVNHYDLNKLTCVERTVKNNPEDVDGLCDIYWASGIKFNSEYSLSSMSGELKGLLVTRDGNNMNTPTANIASITSPTANGGVQLTFTNWSRLDLPESGNIVIDGKTYAYSGYNYDPQTNEMTVNIPPESGRMTIGDRVISFSNLAVQANGDITFKVNEQVTLADLRNKIKIGDMVLDKNGYNITYNPNGSIDTITLRNSSLGSNLNNISVGESVRVGTNVDYKGLPYFMSKINEFARGLARAFNIGQDSSGNLLFDNGFGGHFSAYNMLSGNNTGYNFFTYQGSDGDTEYYLDYHNITAKNFAVSQALLDDPKALATSLSPNPDPSDNKALLELLSLKHNPNVFKQGEIGNYIESIIGELGIVASEAITFESNYYDNQSVIERQRLSVSSVDLNEEMTMMVQLQQMYNACAKLISVLDGIYDTTINKLG